VRAGKQNVVEISRPRLGKDHRLPSRVVGVAQASQLPQAEILPLSLGHEGKAKRGFGERRDRGGTSQGDAMSGSSGKGRRASRAHRGNFSISGSISGGKRRNGGGERR